MGVNNLARVHNFFRKEVDMKRRHITFTIGVLVAVIVLCGITRSQHTHGNSASRTGAIQGRVVNPEGQPALRSDLTTGRLPTGYTDNRGRFLIKDLIPGRYTVSAGKTEDGYADTSSAFHSFGQVSVPEISVDSHQVTDVVIRLGPKEARLFGYIIDAETNKRIQNLQNVQITLRRVDHPDYTYSTGPNLEGRFDLLVPSVPFTIMVKAPGYEVWQYRNEGSKGQAEAANTNKELIISLRRRSNERK
jgi:hypothetical protein